MAVGRNLTSYLMKEILKEIKSCLQAREYKHAAEILLSCGAPADDFVIQYQMADLWKTIPPGTVEFKKIKIALLSTTTAAHLLPVFRFWLAKECLDAEIWEAEYDTVHQTVLDPQSALYPFKPDMVLILINYRDIDLNGVSPEMNRDDVDDFIKEKVQEYVNLWRVLHERLSCFVVQTNVDLPLVRILGNYDGVVGGGRTHLLRCFNTELSRAAFSGVTVFDMDYIASVFGKNRWFDPQHWYHSKHAFHLDATGLVAFYLARLVAAVRGLAKKCIVMDLDNTLWGGVIGDDGLEGIALGNGAVGEAYVDFQKYLLELKNRGIILAVCSKNDEENAKEPFIKHPEMVLHLPDIAVFIANWGNKTDNIQQVASMLNIGLDSLVFVDDNPVERNLVKSFLPQVHVIELPEDPVDYIRAVDQQALFETVAFSNEDRVRNDYYRDNVSRQGFQQQFSDISDYLKNLEMIGRVGEFDEVNVPRIAQLINKSNQFHLTTTRYTEAEIKAMMADRRYHGLYFRLEDRFGDNGLIAAVILDKEAKGHLFIDTWVMSCRVLSRGMEEFIFNEILRYAHTQKIPTILGKYIPTKKNGLVEGLYERLGLTRISDYQGTTVWRLSVAGGKEKLNFIRWETACLLKV